MIMPLEVSRFRQTIDVKSQSYTLNISVSIWIKVAGLKLCISIELPDSKLFTITIFSVTSFHILESKSKRNNTECQFNGTNIDRD